MTDVELQKWWDALLIKGWRDFWQLSEAYQQFKSITGKDWRDCQLLRKPPYSFMYKNSIRAYTANFLPKINDWLLEHPKERDAELLRKLQTSKYDAKDMRHEGPEKKNGGKKMRANEKLISIMTEKIANRNQATNWNVVK